MCVSVPYVLPYVFVFQERWRVTSEQAKAESALRGLEEEKRSMTSRINMEREELERAKVNLSSIADADKIAKVANLQAHNASHHDVLSACRLVIVYVLLYNVH